jgi:transposase
MQQTIMPLIPSGATEINEKVSFFEEASMVHYFIFGVPIFEHHKNDRTGLKIAIGMIVNKGYSRNCEIVKHFAVSKSSVKNWVRQYSEKGVSAFSVSRKKSTCPVLTESVKAKAQELLNDGNTRSEVAGTLNIKYDTIRKAIKDGRLSEPEIIDIVPQKPDLPYESGTTCSERTLIDSQAEMGVACTRVPERVLASLGKLGSAESRFENAFDVANGGVLCALPALEANGLFSNIDNYFQLPGGFYDLTHIVCLLSFMYLCRIKTVEKLRFESSGELGKLIGLDRIPEVKTLREKLSILASDDENVRTWAAELAREWMEANADLTGVLLVDGHMSVYHGSQTELPRKYVSRLRLCMRGTTFFYVNDILGQPFFRIEKVVNDGLIKTLKKDIVPRLLADVPKQPSDQQLEDDPDLHRFILEFDREGYSPAFFKQMWEEHRIGCITYHKYPGEDWPVDEFEEYDTVMPNGEEVKLKLAEREITIGSKKPERLKVREIRKLTSSGHQTSIVTTVRKMSFILLATYMFARWTQENFFKYMLEHFAFDALMGYGTRELSGLETVVNPNWRVVDRKVNSVKSKYNHRLAKFAAMELNPEDDDKKRQKQVKDKAALREEIDLFENELEELKVERATLPKHVELRELPEEFQFKQLESSRKLFTDTIKMIDYRAETAMCSTLKARLGREDDARAIMRELFKKNVNLIPDNNNLQVELHCFNTRRHNQAVKKLLEELNSTETIYPGTNMKLVYSIVGDY